MITDEQIDALINVGTQMSNICFNMSQSDSVSTRDKASMQGAQQRWDSALRDLRTSRAALTAPSAGEASDLVLAPKVPTLEMQNAGWRRLSADGVDTENIEIAAVYEAMISAAPSPSPPSNVDEVDKARAWDAAQISFQKGYEKGKAEAAASPQPHVTADAAGRKLSLWFFRDLSDDQRHKLFRIFGMPAAEIIRLRQGGWLPIETAPRDGTRILIWFVHAHARFSEDPFSEGWAAAHEAHWIDHNGGGWTWHGLCGVATYWQPLPSPPTPSPRKETE